MSRQKRAKKERGRQKCAFEIYWALGDERSYAVVAEKLGVSTSTITRWAREFGWRKRLNNRIAWQSDDRVEPTDDTQTKQIERAIKYLDAALSRMIADLAEGNLKASPQDLVSLHRLEIEISERINRRSDERKKVGQVGVFLPFSGRRAPNQRVIPKSQIDEYLDYLKHGT